MVHKLLIKKELKNKLDEVFFMESNNLGYYPLNKFYKFSTYYLKTMPFVYLVPLSILISVCLYFISDFLVIRLASLLQYGF